MTDFSEIVLAGSTDVTVTTGGRASVVATGADADLDRMDIRVDGKRLLIGTKPGKWNWSSRDGVKVRVSVPALNAATISGSGDIDVDRVNGPFAGRISGSGEMDLHTVNAPTLSLSISGSGDISAAGRCGTGSLSVTGSGDIDASRLTCETLTATTTGSGDIDARATGTADLRVTGSGDITVAGGARCTSKATGSGTTRCS
ncbi:head GIN domain-containing protein [Sandaracinobacter neustonicus]|uniref:head GIN domain-containing protein n=1 Tax=Sandaracinobacter neustonicus TaxID=1715348 RepID=UPI0015E3342B|nr:head GIN domain-containing protein [Sandaracinobacter neustonicus]